MARTKNPHAWKSYATRLNATEKTMEQHPFFYELLDFYVPRNMMNVCAIFRVLFYHKPESITEAKTKIDALVNYTGPRNDNEVYLNLCYGPNEAQRRLKIKSEIRKGANNPAFQHGGKFSPFSKNFIHYEGEEKRLEVQARAAIKTPENNPTGIQYYLSKGHTQEESAKLLKKRQTTFNLEICIEKYGEEAGKKRWEERQKKWLNTLNSKSPEEKNRINKLKTYSSGAKSKVELELYETLKNFHQELISQFTIKKSDDEYSRYVYDFALNKKIIEFNGDFWHCNPEVFSENYYHKTKKMFAKDIWKRDEDKLNCAIDAGYELLIVWEKDYSTNKAKVIEECLKFLATP